jgi:hypothetical protein
MHSVVPVAAIAEADITVPPYSLVRKKIVISFLKQHLIFHIPIFWVLTPYSPVEESRRDPYIWLQLYGTWRSFELHSLSIHVRKITP